MNKINFLDLSKMHKPLLGRIRKKINNITLSSSFIGGKYVTDFESQFASYCNVPLCVGVANGTDALMLALRSIGVGKGDIVLVPAHTFMATAEAVSMVGATPTFVDIDQSTYTMSYNSLEQSDWTNVRAVIPVHLYGQPADMKEINTIAEYHGARVIEDAAQAHGATYMEKKVGSLADIACFSFYPGKNLGAFGDAGAVVGSDVEAIRSIRRIADHGRLSKYQHSEV